MLFFEILAIYKDCSKTFVKLLELKLSTIFFTFNKIGIWDQFFYLHISFLHDYFEGNRDQQETH